MTKKIGISLDEETLQLCDKYAAENSKSRSEFISQAIHQYISNIELDNQKNIIAEELADEIIKGSEAGVAKISKGLFRYAVEVEMIIMILSEQAHIPSEVMDEYRKEAVRNVRRTRGKIDLNDLIARNNREFAEKKYPNILLMMTNKKRWTFPDFCGMMCCYREVVLWRNADHQVTEWFENALTDAGKDEL